MSKKLEDLTPKTQDAAFRALAELKQKNIPCMVTYTFRTLAEQSALYAQGRNPLDVVNCKRHDAGLPPISEGENNIVNNCDGIKTSEGGQGRSPHQFGTALHVVPMVNGNPIWPANNDPRWKQISQVFKAHGFEWGGDWTDFPDMPHYQLKS